MFCIQTFKGEIVLIDSYYTPSDLAVRLIKHVKKTRIKSVIDFCIGDGELIRAALKKWPDINCFGTDISKKSIKSVKVNHPEWKLGVCDFLNVRSQRSCKILKSRNDGFDLILLNPPFSCIGGTIHDLEFDGNTYRVSTAMKFLAESIKHLSLNGSLYAILPISIAYSQKDQKLWNILVENYFLKILEVPNGNYFKNCSPSIIFVSINDRTKLGISIEFNNLSILTKNISLFRGKVSMNTIKHNRYGKYFIHSTNLRNNQIENLNYRVKNKLSEVIGPAILLPRVGTPNPSKICVISEGITYTLSDCVLAIKTKTMEEAIEIKTQILDNWVFFNNLYQGTGARYITLIRLESFFGPKKINGNTT